MIKYGQGGTLRFLAIFLFFVLNQPVLQATIDFSNYVGTYDCFLDGDKQCSPLKGLIYYYRLLRGTFEDKETATGKLCRELFHSLDDNNIHFHCNSCHNNIVAHLTPCHIAQLIKSAELIRTNVDSNIQSVKSEVLHQIKTCTMFNASTIATKNDYDNIMNSANKKKMQGDMNIKEMNSGYQEKYRKVKNDAQKYIRASEEVHLPRKIQQLDASTCSRLILGLERDKAPQDLMDKLNELKLFCEERKKKKSEIEKAYSLARKEASRYKLDDEALSRLVDLFFEACFESGTLFSNDVRTDYEKYTPYYLLQAFLYAKFDSRLDLIKYCKVFNVELPTDVNIKNKASQDIYEKSVLAYFCPQELPITDDYIQSCFHIDGVKFEFHDCMENAMRHIIQIKSFNSKTKKFDPNLLPTNGKIAPDLVKYLQDFPTTDRANTSIGHNNWAQMVSNIKGVVYRKKYDQVQRFRSLGRQSYLHKSIISDDISIEDIDYLSCSDEQQYLYEMKASIDNVIVVLNYLLDLKLFDLSDNNFVNKHYLRRVEFVEEYFPKIQKIMGWEIKSPLQALFKQEIIKLNINQDGVFGADFKFDIDNKVSHASIMLNGDNKRQLQESNYKDFLYNLLFKGDSTISISAMLNREQYESKNSMSVINQQKTSDLVRAYKHSLIVNGPSATDVDSLFSSNSFLSSNSIDEKILSDLLLKIKRLNPDLVLSQFIQLNSYKRKSWMKSIYGGNNGKELLNAIAQTQNKNVLNRILNYMYEFDNDYLKVTLAHKEMWVYDILSYCCTRANAEEVERIINNLPEDQSSLLKTIDETVNRCKESEETKERFLMYLAKSNFPDIWLKQALLNENITAKNIIHVLEGKLIVGEAKKKVLKNLSFIHLEKFLEVTSQLNQSMQNSLFVDFDFENVAQRII